MEGSSLTHGCVTMSTCDLRLSVKNVPKHGSQIWERSQILGTFPNFGKFPKFGNVPKNVPKFGNRCWKLKVCKIWERSECKTRFSEISSVRRNWPALGAEQQALMVHGREEEGRREELPPENWKYLGNISACSKYLQKRNFLPFYVQKKAQVANQHTMPFWNKYR